MYSLLHSRYCVMCTLWCVRVCNIDLSGVRSRVRGFSRHPLLFVILSSLCKRKILFLQLCLNIPIDNLFLFTFVRFNESFTTTDLDSIDASNRPPLSGRILSNAQVGLDSNSVAVDCVHGSVDLGNRLIIFYIKNPKRMVSGVLNYVLQAKTMGEAIWKIYEDFRNIKILLA